MPGSWTDWSLSLANSETLRESGYIIRLADKLARAAAISNESALALLLWLGSVAMIQHTKVQWPSGIWEPAGLTLAVVEEDGVPIDSITNAFIQLAGSLGLDPIHDTVKEGPAGLIARLETASTLPEQTKKSISVDSLESLASIDTNELDEQLRLNKGNGRALIYPSGRALMSYLYDTPFFNAFDELIQHGNLSLRGKLSSHQLREVNLSTFVPFYQGALVTLTHDSRVQNNMSSLLRQMLVLWPTSGTQRNKNRSRIDMALHEIEKVTREGLDTLTSLSDGTIQVPYIPEAATKSFIDAGAGVRYTVLNRHQRIIKLSLAVAFWRICAGGQFALTKGDMTIADSILHLHEMGGRLFELVMAKGRLGHEFMRIFIRLLDGEEIHDDSRLGEELSHASELVIGATALERLNHMSVIRPDGKLSDEYRFVTGQTIRDHKLRWQLQT